MPIPGVAALPITGPGDVVGVDRPRFTAYTSDGRTWNLGDATDDGDSWVVLMPGMTGLEHPPVTAFSAATPRVAGARFTGLHVDPRQVFIPIAAIAGSYSEATALRRQLVSSFSPLTENGTVTLEAAQPDGTRRTLVCRFFTGMEGDEAVDQAGMTWATYGLVGTCYDPWWYGDDAQPAPWTNPTPRPFFPLGPDLFTLSDSNILGDAILSNPGDVETYPRWVLEGPATSFTLASGGSSITVNAILAAGELLIIDTDPTKRIVSDGIGTNLWDHVPDGYTLWTLPPGNVAATFTVTGATAATQLTVQYATRYYRW